MEVCARVLQVKEVCAMYFTAFKSYLYFYIARQQKEALVK